MQSHLLHAGEVEIPVYTDVRRVQLALEWTLATYDMQGIAE